MKKILIPAFVLMCVAQWLVPAHMIGLQEAIATTGKRFNFETRPVDPTDPFRGAYVTLSFTEEEYKVTDGTTYNYGEEIYVSLRDSAGYARIAGLSKTPPAGDYVKAEVGYLDSDNSVHVYFPFTRFYMEETKAPDAEIAYRDTNRNDSTQHAYAVVGVLEGESALLDVMINGRSLVDVSREYAATGKLP